MKRYKFKLEAVLKLRKFKEENIKLELGKINQEIDRIEHEIAKQKQDIADGYASQEAILKEGSDSRAVSFFPMFLDGKKAHIEKLQNELWIWRKKYEAKRDELTHARGEVKVMESLKEKDMLAFKKEQSKLENKKIEDIVHMWQQSKD